MEIQSIISVREIMHKMEFHVVYEWEESISKECNIPIESIAHKGVSDFPILEKLYWRAFKMVPFQMCEKMHMAFIMNPGLNYLYPRNVVPIYLDVFEKDIPMVVSQTKYLTVFYVTSLDIANRINKLCKYSKCHYISQCVPDTYIDYTVAPRKTISIFQYGRSNKLLHSLTLRYCELHPDVSYIYKDNSNEKSEYKCRKGKNESVVPFPNTREEFVEILKKSALVLLSTPNVDGEKSFGNGVDFFTARWFETAAFYCHIVGRYTQNGEAEKLSIDTICTNIISDDYQNFEAVIDKYLQIPAETNINKYKAFLEKHKASSIGKEVIRGE